MNCFKQQGDTFCRVIQPGCLPYAEAWQLQQEIAAARQRHAVLDTLMLLEHFPVYTMGRAGSRENIKVPEQVLAARGLEVIEVDRGGDITYHGPGQLVGYPILDLREHGQDLHVYREQLEEVLIKTLDTYGIRGFRENELTGVWTKQGKIAAIGIGVHRWVTMHGFSLNVNPDMSYFDLINPCGITDRPVVSMSDLGVEISLAAVTDTLIQQFANVFGVMITNEVLPARRYRLG